MGSGALRASINKGGKSTNQVLIPSHIQVSRQPTVSISHCASGGCTAI